MKESNDFGYFEDTSDSLEITKPSVLDSIDDLVPERVISYLFYSELPLSVKKLICDEINKYSFDDEKILNIKSLFVSKEIFDAELLDADFCPNELKKVIIDEIYGSNLTQTICDNNISLQRKKVIIDLRLSSSEALGLLGKDIPLELRDYIIDSRISSAKDIVDSLRDDNISDEIKDKIIIRKVDMGNLFEVTKSSLYSEANRVCLLKGRNIEDYINNLTSDNILSVITNPNIIRRITDDIVRLRYDTIEEAIEKASKAQLARIILLYNDERLINTVKEKRIDTLFEIIREMEPRKILLWLNVPNLPSDIKDYIIDYHGQTLDNEIKKHAIAYPMRTYLSRSSFLPPVVERKIFDEYRDDFVRQFSSLTNEQIIGEIMYGGCGDLILGLLIDLGVNEENIFTLLSQYNVEKRVIDNVFARKKEIFKNFINSLDISDIISLSKLQFSNEIKNRILDVSSEVVSNKLDGLSREVLLGYLKNTNVLFSVKRRIMEHFGIFEIDLHNCLETMDLDNAELLINSYSDIKNLISMVGIDFQSFLQYGSGSKKYPNWLIDLTNIMNDNRVSDFIKVKNYFFNNYYSDYNNGNGVSIISSFLEILGNFYRYNELCLYLANNGSWLSRDDKLNIYFLFNVEGCENVSVPKRLEDISLYKKRLYEDVCQNINKGLNEEEAKSIFNKLLFCRANLILSSIGGTEALKTLRKDNINSSGITSLIDELLLYSNVIEMVNDTNNVGGLTEVLDFVFSDMETLTIFQNIFSQFEKKVERLYEADSINHLTSLAKVRDIPGVIDYELSKKYGGEVFDFSDKNYVLYGHVFSVNESFEDRLCGRVSGKSNFISVTPISYKGQKYYWDNSEGILVFDRIPKGSFIRSSIYNMGTNHKLSNNCCEVSQFDRTQRGILETSAVFQNNSEALLFAEGIVPCGLALPGGRKPTDMEMEYHKKYNLPFVITQSIGKTIDSPKMVFSNNDCFVDVDTDAVNLLKDIIGILEPNVILNKETDIYTGREVALFTDSHSMYEPTLAVLEDIRRKGIREIYSLGDNIGDGPNPSEVFDLLEEYGVVSIAGNSEYYNILGIESFPYIQGVRVESQNWTKNKLGVERGAKLNVFKASIDLMIGDKKLALCHFINDVRWDFEHFNNVYNYRANINNPDSAKQFLHTNSEKAERKITAYIENHKANDPTVRGYLSAQEEPLFGGKKIEDYDAVIQGHAHFNMTDKLESTDIYTLRAVGMGYEDDYNDTACYYVLKERKDGDFDIEKRLVTFNKNNLLADICASDYPSKERVLKYVNSGKSREAM